ncbi:MAG: hypothetical protein GXY83_29840 [Rhodopirellula sp.]|nr:hypothetical protein [Rhodopirellula sp.]
MPRVNKSFVLILLPFVFVWPASAANDTAHDEHLAAKYGLRVPPASREIPPAPDWIRQAEIVSSSAAVWEGYEFLLKETPVTRLVRARSGHTRMRLSDYYPEEKVSGLDAESVSGILLLSHVPHSADAFRLAHEHGIKAIPYLHFMCVHTNYADQDIFYFEHPEILMKDDKGHWVHTGMDGSDRLHRFRTCANSPSYWKLSLAYVKKMMEWGADGVFIDNAGRRPACFATQYNSVRNPEFEPYVHEHLFPDASHDYAWGRFLEAIRTLVKSHGDDKIVVLNSGIGDPWQSTGDCCMWESFIYSWAWEGRRHTWSDVKAKAKANQWYLDAGRRIVALAFLEPKRHDMKNNSFWAFACARLVDFVLWVNLDHTEVEFLNRVHLGRGLESVQETEQVAHRFFENGLIVLNDSLRDGEITIRVADGFAGTQLLDLYDGKATVPVDEGMLKVRVPSKMARIFVAHATE